MPAAVENIQRTQITTLENGLKSLRHSKLMNSKELKDMYDAIEKHHREVRLAHLAGTPKDLIDQAKKDTKFFFILIKLLNETLIGTQHEQKDSLREVYSWYVGNKHTLASGPRFGKQKEKGKNKPVLSRSRPVSGLNKLGHVSQVASKALEKEYGDELRGLASPRHGAKADTDTLHQLQAMPKSMSPDMSLYRQSSMTMSACRTDIGSPDSSATKRLSETYHQSLLPKRQNKPLAHLYNPHAREHDKVQPQNEPDLAARPVRFTIHTYDLRDTGRSSVSADGKSLYLRQWEDFQEQIASGQNELNKYQHYGRLGVAGGQRYVAHEDGLAAEEFTPHVIATVARNSSQDVTQEQEETEEPPSSPVPLEKQSLEDFYQTTQGHYPAKLPKYPSFRLKSAPSTARQMTSAIGHVVPVTSANRLNSSSLVVSSDDKAKDEEPEPSKQESPLKINVSAVDTEARESPEPVVKLDTVVTMIDSVTDEMTFFKEKLTPEPMAGFRLPIVEVDPTERPQTAPSLGALARPCTPMEEQERDMRSISAMSAGGAELRPESAAAGGSESPRGSQIDARSVRSFTTEEWNTWKERFMHDNRYKWQPTPAGGHAYYRKAAPRPGSRAAGQGPSGSRPKTAPQTPRERWNTAAPHEENKKPPVAATHTTTEVDPQVMDTMLAVRRLGGRNAKQRRYRFFMDYSSDAREHSRSAMTTPAMEYVSFIAPKPVAGSRASSAMTRSRSAMDGPVSPFPIDDDFTAEEKEEAEEIDSLGGDLDLPAMDDLDDDLDENFQYEGDIPVEGEEDVAMESDEQPALDEPQHLDADLESAANASDEKPSDTKESESEQDFDSVCIRSSTQESDLDVDQQCTESRQLINEIATLVTKRPEAGPRPVSSHSRVTFQDEPVECEPIPEGKEPLNEQGRKVLKPKSILVPRHIQPPPSVGLTIVQFHRGASMADGVAMQRSAHEPTCAPPPNTSRQVLSKSSHFSIDPSDLEQTDYEKYAISCHHPREHLVKPSTAPAGGRRPSITDIDSVGIRTPRSHHPPKPRMFSRSFPKSQRAQTAEFDGSLAVEGRGGPRSHSAQVSGRSAGVSPLRSRSASYYKMIQKQEAMLKNARALPPRSAPSIPSVQDAHTRLPGNGPFSAEHDTHARKEHSPRRYMEKVGVLRKSPHWVPTSAKTDQDGYLTTTLRCVRMQPSSRDQQSPEQPVGHPCTPVAYFESDPDRISERSEEGNEVPVPTRATNGTTRLYLYSGRPIPDYASVKTPEESRAADMQLKEAKAAVDIQKYFRGYVVRRDYNYLLKEERHRKEDERLAALQIQKAYRAHLARRNRIYSRTPNPETLQWAREYKAIQLENEKKRMDKAGAVAMQNSINKAKADATLSIIGPHLEVYMPFHPKKTGPKKVVLDAAATCIQRHLKGWIIRKKFEDIKRKAKAHANSWGRFMQQYRELVRRVQTRHGITRPKVPFSFQQVSEFMDVKKRYESGFESHAFAGELEIDELPEYFRECDLYPVQSDIDEAMDIVFRGQQIKKGLQKHQVMELTFQLYPPAATGITNSRKSTWTNPIIDGEEGNKILGTEFIEPTNFETAWKFVSGTIKERREAQEAAIAKRESDDVKAKLDAIKLKQKRDSISVDALKEEDEKSTASSDKQETMSSRSSKDKHVSFTETVPEKGDSPHEHEEP